MNPLECDAAAERTVVGALLCGLSAKRASAFGRLCPELFTNPTWAAAYRAFVEHGPDLDEIERQTGVHWRLLAEAVVDSSEVAALYAADCVERLERAAHRRRLRIAAELLIQLAITAEWWGFDPAFAQIEPLLRQLELTLGGPTAGHPPTDERVRQRRASLRIVRIHDDDTRPHSAA